MTKVLTQEKKIRAVARQEAVKVFREVMSDPDFGLELTAEAKRRLRRAMKSGRPTVSFAEIKRRYL